MTAGGRSLCSPRASSDFGDGTIGVWAIGGKSIGPIFALDSVAREWTSWGEAAEPGSRAMETVERLAGYPEVRAARQAVSAKRT